MTSSKGDVTRWDRALGRQLLRYQVRFNDAFWEFFEAEVQTRLPEGATLVDLACGPGLFLRNVSSRLPNAKLHGYDWSEAMLDNAHSLDYVGAAPTLGTVDIVGERLPLDDQSVDLLCIAAAMHTFEDPWTFMAEVRRVLAPEGFFLVYDWLRVPMKDYIAQRQEEPGDDPEDRYPRALEMFATHNKYAVGDWQWLLAQGRFNVVAEATPHPRAMAWLLRAA